MSPSPEAAVPSAEDEQQSLKEQRPLRWSLAEIRRAVQAYEVKEVDSAVAGLTVLGEKLQDLFHYPKMDRPIEVLRFLMTRNYHLDKTERDFRNMVQWRRANQVDTIVQDYTPPDELMQYYPAAMMQGLDKQGNPVWVERSGAADLAGLLNKYGLDFMVRHAIWLREVPDAFIQQWEQEHQRLYRGCTIIVDLHGTPLINPNIVLQYTHTTARLDQDYYPGTQIRIWLIRPPTYFRVIWGLLQLAYDPWFAHLMTLCPTATYRSTLAPYIDLDQVLPPELGGRGTVIAGMPSNMAGGGKLPTSSSSAAAK